MAKLIRSAVECAHKLGSRCMYHGFGMGEQAPFETCICIDEQNFPDNCPLEEAEIKPEFNG